jgi:hypothetical protein
MVGSDWNLELGIPDLNTTESDVPLIKRIRILLEIDGKKLIKAWLQWFALHG